MAADLDNLTSVSALLEKQVGLRLNPAAIKLASMVVDRVARVPAEN
jgi:uncharacterized protein (TIGR03435 family)